MGNEKKKKKNEQELRPVKEPRSLGDCGSRSFTALCILHLRTLPRCVMLVIRGMLYTRENLFQCLVQSLVYTLFTPSRLSAPCGEAFELGPCGIRAPNYTSLRLNRLSNWAERRRRKKKKKTCALFCLVREEMTVYFLLCLFECPVPVFSFCFLELMYYNYI